MSTRPIPHNRPALDESDFAAVLDVLRSGWIAPGPEGKSLERDIERLHGGGAAFAVSSGTSALFLGLIGLGLPADSLVAVPSYACSALLDAVRLASCRPLVVDVDPDELTMSPESLADRARASGRPEAAIVVHTYGAVAPLDGIQDVAGQVVEDCCHSLGGVSRFGIDGTYGSVAAHSFYATKPVAGALGGMVFTRDAAVGERISGCLESGPASGRDRLWIDLRLSDIHAALARSQLARIEALKARRAWIAERYLEVCAPRIAPTWITPGSVAADGRLVYRFVLRGADEAERETWLDRFVRAGIGADRLPGRDALLHRGLGLDARLFPGAELAAVRTLSLPIHPGLTDAEVDRICAVLAALPA